MINVKSSEDACGISRDMSHRPPTNIYLSIMFSTVIWNPLDMFGIGQVGLAVSLFEHLQQAGVIPYLLDTQYRWASNFKSVSGLFNTFKFDLEKWWAFSSCWKQTSEISHVVINLKTPRVWKIYQQPLKLYIAGIVLLQQFLLVCGFMGNERHCTVARLTLIGSCFAWVFFSALLCILTLALDHSHYLIWNLVEYATKMSKQSCADVGSEFASNLLVEWS